ncbi:hypothetical protein CSB11_02395 [Candidatus Campbellbacteria bacterium]|nr:MAG: hypothetical protein CSB11_02395 [Candidatus Campbellbacteria bacterium]
MKIIGITGTIGAGKGTVVDYLVDQKNFVHLSVRSYLTEILENQNKELSRENMFNLANKLREENGSDFIIQELYKKATETNKNVIIESVRTVGEVKALQNKQNFYLISVDADIQKRYNRILERKSSTDNISFEQFQTEEEKEMISEDETKQNLKKCIEMSDFQIQNNGDFESLYKQVDQILEKIEK